MGRMLISIYESGYLDQKKAYKMSFIKGMLAGFGGVLGATILVAFLLWALSLFSNVPFIGRIAQNVTHTIETSTQYQQPVPPANKPASNWRCNYRLISPQRPISFRI